MEFLPLVNLWKVRHLIFQFAVFHIKIRFRSTYLGILWAALEPLLMFIILYLVFTSIRSRAEDYAIFLITGIMIYQIFVRGTTGGAASITGNSGVIKSLNIRKELFPVVATVAMGLLAFVDIGVFFGLMPIFQFIPDWTLLLLPLVLFLLLILILGLSYILSILNAFWRDVSIVWHIFTRLLFFISPIFWSLDEANDLLRAVQQINPLGQLIELGHILVLDKEIPIFSYWIHASVIIFAIFFTGFFIFHKLEKKVTEEL